MSIGWRPHDLETSFVPFLNGVGVQVGISDPVFMARYGKQPVTDHPEFPYDAAKFDRDLAAGDAKAKEGMFLGTEWIKEVHTYHDWDNLKFLRDNWEGPLVVKGISNAHVRFITLSPSSDSDILFRMRKRHCFMASMGSSYPITVNKSSLSDRAFS